MPFGLCRAFGSGGLAEVVKFVLAGVSYREPVVRSTLVHFEVRGAKKDLGQFCGMSNFQDESLNMKIILRAKRQKQKDAMFSLSRRSIFNNSELGSQT